MDPTRQAIYECIQAAFKAAGLNAITSPEQIINWAAIDDDVKTQIAISIRGCVKQKLDKDPGDLVGVFLVATQQEPAMPVSDLIEIIYQLVQQA
ncbi:MAG TPA: hypothetical protein VHU41_12095 [Thermoanaerobaculia bacterium]|jgi:hypothetical protein|nr:hypothetical protein [Thermoanaerobaculia bacterium]